MATTITKMHYQLKRASSRLLCNYWKPLLVRDLCTAAHKTEQIHLLGESYTCDDMTNVSAPIIAKLGKNLHHQKNHPLKIIKDKITTHVYESYRSSTRSPLFTVVDNLSPIVTVEQNFDSLLVPLDHVSRSKNDNYYINSNYLLRAHTTAHERDLIKMGLDAFICVGDVYRRDEIDKSHYPVFHQVEGVRIFTRDELLRDVEEEYSIFESSKRTMDKQEVHTLEAVKLVEFSLKQTVEKIMHHLFGQAVEMRWVDAYFPFTHPSWELEIKLDGEWMEMLGCGVLEHGVMVKAGASEKIGWAFGIGLERLAMKLFNIPDIRLFWSEDERFLSQFQSAQITQFKPFSKFPPTYKDITFWITQSFTSNNLYEVIRSTAGDIVEKVDLIDQFVHPKTGRESHCYRITYRAWDRTFTDEEINTVQDKVREEVQTQLSVQLR